LFDQAREGEVDIVWTAPALTPGRFPKIEMFDLPFVPSRRALVSSKALADFAAANLKDEFGEVWPLCFSCADRGVIHANQPIRTVEDIKDLKIHAQSRWAGEALYQLGARPVLMPAGQLQAAINAHIVDGCLDPWHLTPALRLNDVLKTHTEFSDTSPSSTTFVLAMNSAAYDRLPHDLKAVVDSNSGQAAAAMAGAMWDIEAASIADGVVRNGDSIVTLLPEAVAHWRKLTEPVVEKWLKEVKEQKADGGKLLAAAHTLMLKYVNEPEPQPPQIPAAQPAQQTAAQPPTVSSPQPQQTVPAQAPQATLTSPPNIAPKLNTAAPATTASTPPPSTPLVKPVPPQPPAPAPHVATPSPAPPSAPGPAAVAQPVAPAAPAPQVAAPAPPSTASIAPAAKPAAAPALTPTPPPAAAPPAPASKSLDIPL
jgi:TRAP-type C4-dicarboxylate transport system substrate-binding protein